MLSEKIDIKEALSKSKELSQMEIENRDTFSSYSPIYLAPTSNIKETVNISNKIERALTVGSHGLFAYELALNNIKNIDCFDANILQYFYFELMNSAIKNDSYENFISNFTAEKIGSFQNINKMLSTDMFYDVLEYVNSPALEYWQKLFMKTNITTLLYTNLFRTTYVLNLPYLKNLSSVYDKDNFYKLKELLNSEEVKIDYHICDISEIPTEFEGKKYDLILFDNILQYYKSIKTLSSIDKVYKFVKEKIDPMLNENGQLQLCYGFYLVTFSALKVLGNIPEIINVVMKSELDKSLKNDFIPLMLKKYKDLDIKFIDGVEIEVPNAKNSILTYTKN